MPLRVASGVDPPGCSAPPWHWAQERLKTALPCCSSSLSSGSGSGKVVEPVRMARASSSTPGEEKSVCWKAAGRRASARAARPQLARARGARRGPAPGACRSGHHAGSALPVRPIRVLPMMGTRGAPGGQVGATPSGPVIATLKTGMTARQRSTEVSSVG